MESLENMDKSIRCLALELPEPVYDDVAAKWKAFNEDYTKLKGFLILARSELQADHPMTALDIIHNVIEKKLI